MNKLPQTKARRAYSKTLFALQEGKCAICGLDSRMFTNGLVQDHCHATGKLRGLLCPSCNSGLGFFFDSVQLLHRASAYLRFHRKPKGFIRALRESGATKF